MSLSLIFVFLAFVPAFAALITAIFWIKKNGDGVEKYEQLRKSKAGKIIKCGKIIYSILMVLALISYLGGIYVARN